MHLQMVFKIIFVYHDGVVSGSMYIIKFYLDVVEYELMRQSD
jgi:ABC-type maltose transport system permease subunit